MFVDCGTMAYDEENVNIGLCLEVKKHPCLYDNSLEDYAKAQVVEKTWSDIGLELGLSGAECKRRWRNLRTVYVRKRAEALMGTGSKKKYYLNRYMQFLVPYLKATTKTTRFKFVDTNEQPSTSLQVHSPKNQPAENFLENESENEVQPANVREESEDDHEVDVQDLRHTKRLAVSRPRFHRGYVRYVQTKTQKVSADSENPRRQFLMSLLPEINELKEYAFKAFKRRVLALLDELEMPCATTSTTSYSNWNSEPSYGEDVNPKLENN